MLKTSIPHRKTFCETHEGERRRTKAVMEKNSELTLLSGEYKIQHFIGLELWNLFYPFLLDFSHFSTVEAHRT